MKVITRTLVVLLLAALFASCTEETTKPESIVEPPFNKVYIVGTWQLESWTGAYIEGPLDDCNKLSDLIFDSENHFDEHWVFENNEGVCEDDPQYITNSHVTIDENNNITIDYISGFDGSIGIFKGKILELTETKLVLWMDGDDVNNVDNNIRTYKRI